ncbi:distal tail protein Dit [Peribacillus asahii]|nr:distal tail protein Dit [Peribacillus asahii]USK72606.1 phage tail family protein [Peribacillus asahii]
MSMRTVSYAGVILTDVFDLKKVYRSILPPRDISIIDVPAKHGAYFTGTRYGTRKIELDVAVRKDTPENFMATIRSLAFALDVDEPSDLVISDEPDKVYYAILSDDTEIDQIFSRGEGKLTFLCPDPFAYSLTPKSLTPVDGLFTFVNDGTTTTFPIFTVNFGGEASFVSFTSPDGIILIGNPSEPDQIKLPATQNVLNDTMESTSGWVNAGTSFDSGRVNVGSIGVKDVDGIAATNYGTGTGWHGPAVRKDLSQQIDDFTVKVRMNFKSQDGTSTLDGNQNGRLEIYLFDVNGLKLGKMVMRDSYSAYEFNIPEIYLGNTTFLEKQPSVPKAKKVNQKKYTTYVIKKGDTLSEIAQKYKIKTADLAK